MDFRPGADVADLALNQDLRIDGFESFDGLFRLPDVLHERQRRQVEDDGIKTRFGDIQGVRQRMGMVRVKEDRVVVLLSQAPHQSGYLPHAEKFPLSLGGADRYRDLRSRAAPATAFNRTRSATLKWPIATPSFSLCSRAFRKVCMLGLLLGIALSCSAGS